MQRTTPVRLLWYIGEFVLNFAVAALFTNLLRDNFRLYHGASSSALLMKDYMLNAAIAFALGYFVYRRWRFESAKWVWIAGFCSFAIRATIFWISQHGPLNAIHGSTSLYWEMSGVGCLSDRSICSEMVYTFPFLRTVFYSAGAFFCVWFRPREFTALPDLKRAILALRRS